MAIKSNFTDCKCAVLIEADENISCSTSVKGGQAGAACKFCTLQCSWTAASGPCLRLSNSLASPHLPWQWKLRQYETWSYSHCQTFRKYGAIPRSTWGCLGIDEDKNKERNVGELRQAGREMERNGKLLGAFALQSCRLDVLFYWQLLAPKYSSEIQYIYITI